jgi:hypothetical protein
MVVRVAESRKQDNQRRGEGRTIHKKGNKFGKACVEDGLE